MLSNLYPWSKDSARIVFVDVAKQPNKAAQNPNTLKLSSVTEVRRMPPTMGTKDAQMRQSKYFFHTSHCRMTVVAGVNDLIVCIKETGMYLKLTFPNTMLIQKTNDIGNILLQRSSESTSISGLIFSILIATYAPIEEHMKCTHDTERGNLKSSFWKIHLFMIMTVTLKPHHWRIARRDRKTLHWKRRLSSIDSNPEDQLPPDPRKGRRINRTKTNRVTGWRQLHAPIYPK